ncbi:hypothetical protein D3C87_931180 [compost metagenome]
MRALMVPRPKSWMILRSSPAERPPKRRVKPISRAPKTAATCSSLSLRASWKVTRAIARRTMAYSTSIEMGTVIWKVAELRN